jgi:SAM-dependent methyltransferase
MQPTDDDGQHWARVAAEWVAWARTPNHDAFWSYRAALAAFLRPGTGAALDLGCGEGRVSRELTALGYHVIAFDPVGELLAAAAEARSASHYVRADAAALPFRDAYFDLVVAYNVLMDVPDVPAVVTEMRRVLRPTGRAIISIVHPFADRGRFADSTPDAPFVVRGSYFGRERFEGVEQRGGLRMHFAGWSQPVEDYAEALSDAGFAITGLREPVPDLSIGGEHLRHGTRMPFFLWLEVRPFPPG